MRWYFRVHAPEMSAQAGAIWPVIRHKEEWDKLTPELIKHEESHLKSQLAILVIPWLILYGIFYLIEGYTSNPFEEHANAVEEGIEKDSLYGWIKYIWKKPKKKG